MAPKKIPYTEKKVPMSFCTPRKYKTAFDKRLKELGLNRSEVITGFIKEFLSEF